jgi:hypothetical protein
MTMIDNPQGCKVGWAVYDNEAEAKARAAEEEIARERKFKQGYDFGYQWPGSIKHYPDHPKLGVECWEVVTT